MWEPGIWLSSKPHDMHAWDLGSILSTTNDEARKSRGGEKREKESVCEGRVREKRRRDRERGGRTKNRTMKQCVTAYLVIYSINLFPAFTKMGFSILWAMDVYKEKPQNTITNQSHADINMTVL